MNRVLNAAKPGHSADPVSAITKKGKTLLGVEHPILTPFLSEAVEASQCYFFENEECISKI